MLNFSKTQRLYLYQFCADMVAADLPLYDALSKLQREGKVLLGAGFAKKLGQFISKMATTQSVAGVFEGFVPRQELSVIYSSEKSGSLAEGFLGIVRMIHFRDSLRSQIIRAVSFPAIMIVLSLVVIGGYAMKVFPLFASVLPVNSWPAVTRALYEFGTALVNGLWLTILLGIITVIIVVRLLMTNLSGPLRNSLLDRIIPFSTYKKMTASLLLNNLSAMLRNNIPITDSLGIIQLNASRWLRGHIRLMNSRMAQGLDYGEALNTGLLGKAELLNISIYAALPSFYDVLLSVSEKANTEIEKNIGLLAGMLKSLSTLVLGGCVIWVFVALYALSDQISTMVR